MCIIIAKMKNVEIPKKKILQTCWKNNDDGAGFMFENNGQVEIVKGLMTFEDFYKKLTEYNKKYNFKNKNLVIHFRIGTSGGLDASKTHPFILSNDEKELNKTHSFGNVGVAHNGILSNYTYNKKLSDTQNFIKDFLYYVYKMDNNFVYNQNATDLILSQLDTYNKLAIITKNGAMTLYNKQNFIEENGIFYSNNTFKENRFSVKKYNYSYSYDYDYDNDFEKEYINYNDLDNKLYYEFEEALYDDFINGKITEDEFYEKLENYEEELTYSNIKNLEV